jgi:hypothetical protein
MGNRSSVLSTRVRLIASLAYAAVVSVLAMSVFPRTAATVPVVLIALGLPLVFRLVPRNYLYGDAVPSHALDHAGNVVCPEHHHGCRDDLGRCDLADRSCGEMRGGSRRTLMPPNKGAGPMRAFLPGVVLFLVVPMVALNPHGREAFVGYYAGVMATWAAYVIALRRSGVSPTRD